MLQVMIKRTVIFSIKGATVPKKSVQLSRMHPSSIKLQLSLFLLLNGASSEHINQL